MILLKIIKENLKNVEDIHPWELDLSIGIIKNNSHKHSLFNLRHLKKKNLKNKLYKRK